MAIKAKVLMTITIDEDEYPVPVDGQVGEEIQDALKEFFHDIEGMKVTNVRIITEN